MSEILRNLYTYEAETLERELGLLWAQVAERGEGRVSGAKHRVLNVIAAVANQKAAADVSAFIPGLARKYPGRYIVIILNPESSDISSREQDGVRCEIAISGSAQLYYERILFTNVPGKTEELTASVKALLRYEVPTVLWWRYIFNPKDYLLEDFSAVAKRIIIDSMTLKMPQAGFVKIAELNDHSRNNAVVRDLNWARLSPWRHAVAGFYDISAYRPFLSRLSGLEIEYSHQISRHNLVNNSQVLLLFGWMASRLGWRPISEFIQEVPEIHYRINMEAQDRLVTCHFKVFSAASHAKAGIRGVRLLAGGEPEACFSVRQTEDMCHMETKIDLSGKSPALKTTCLEIGDEAELLSSEMGVSTQDALYNETLAYLKGNEILWGLTRPGVK